MLPNQAHSTFLEETNLYRIENSEIQHPPPIAFDELRSCECSSLLKVVRRNESVGFVGAAELIAAARNQRGLLG